MKERIYKFNYSALESNFIWEKIIFIGAIVMNIVKSTLILLIRKFNFKYKSIAI
jgi:hypothetical protein